MKMTQDEESMVRTIVENIFDDLVSEGEMAGFLPPEAKFEVVTQEGRIGFLYECPFGRRHLRSVLTVADPGHMHKPEDFCGDDKDYFRDFSIHLLRRAKTELGDLMRSFAER